MGLFTRLELQEIVVQFIGSDFLTHKEISQEMAELAGKNIIPKFVEEGRPFRARLAPRNRNRGGPFKPAIGNTSITKAIEQTVREERIDYDVVPNSESIVGEKENKVVFYSPELNPNYIKQRLDQNKIKE